MSGNQLKVIALLSMTIDHVGVLMFCDAAVLRVLGRLAFPIFAYFLSEGCHYTHDKRRYLASLVIVGVLCQVVYGLAMGSLEQSIMTTLALGAVTVFACQEAASRGTWLGWLLLFLALALDEFACNFLPVLLPDSDYRVDYGLAGVLLPALCHLPRLMSAPDARNSAPVPDARTLRRRTLACCTLGVVLVAIQTTGPLAWVQWFGLAAIPLLATYDGTRGRWHMKYFFYAYYPLHLAAIYAISLVI